MIDIQVAALGAHVELARRHLYDYCRLKLPDFYALDRVYLKDIADTFEDFVLRSKKHFLILNVPPRFGKSLTAQSGTEWLFGELGIDTKVMTGSYNERLSSIFARSVRNTIQTEKADETIVYRDIFPHIKVKYGEASASMWSLEGSDVVNYLATSPGGTATGIGANFLIIDDPIKSAEEAYNENVLDDIWEWFTNTMMQRLEGNGKVIIIMTRWAKGDLAGRVIEAYGDDVEVITYKAVQDDGSMLCDSILTREQYDMKTKEMNVDIVEANYNQKPIDVKGRLYTEFKEWQKLPDESSLMTVNFTDTADTGTDFLCSVSGVEYEGDFYIKDLVFTDEPMEVTEPAVADLLIRTDTKEANIESNNGGRGFARNVETRLRELKKFVNILQVPQTKNKESRILASSGWVQNHVYMPHGWAQRYPAFYRQVMSYQRKGRNAHDDAVDVLASIYEAITNDRRPQIIPDLAAPDSSRDRVLNLG